MGVRHLRNGCSASPAGGLSRVPVQPVPPVACAKKPSSRHTIGTSSPAAFRKFNKFLTSSTPCTPVLHRDSTPPQVMSHRSPEQHQVFRKSASEKALDRPIADQHVCPSPITCGRTDSKVSLVTTFADTCENHTQADRAPWAQDVNFTHVLNKTQASHLVSENLDASMLMVVRSVSGPSIRQVVGVDAKAEKQVQNPDETSCIRALIAAMKQLKLDQESQLDMVKRQLENKFSELKEALEGNVQLATTTASVVGDLSDRLSALSNAFHIRSEKSDVSSILGMVHQTQREVTRLSEELASDRILRLGRSQIEVPPEMTDMMQGALTNKAAQNEEHRPSDDQCHGETVPSPQPEYLLTWQVAAHAHATALDNDQMSDVCKEVIDKIRPTNSVCTSIQSGTNKLETTCVSDTHSNGICESSGDPSDINNKIQQSMQRVWLAFRKANGLGHGDSLEQQHLTYSQPHQRPLLNEQQQLQSKEVHSTQPVNQLLEQPQVHQQRCNSTRGKPTCESIPEEPGDEGLPEHSGADER